MFKELEMAWGDKQFVFIMPKDSDFSAKEAIEYLRDNHTLAETEKFDEVVEPFSVPDDKQRQRMFVNDLKLGLRFCRDKYNTTTDNILREARRLSPGIADKLVSPGIDDKLEENNG